MNGLPRVVTIAWCLTDASARGPARRLSHAAITAAAIEVADDQGLGAVTMARVAQRLGFTTMALYRYVSTKAELLLLMADAAVALPDLKVERGEGASGLRRWAAQNKETGKQAQFFVRLVDRWNQQFVVQVGHEQERQAGQEHPVVDVPPTTYAPETGEEQWAYDMLTQLGNPAPSFETIQYVVAWQRGESTAARFNPLATTQAMQPEPADPCFNYLSGKCGVRNYVSRVQGIEATTVTLTNGFYPNVYQGLLTNDQNPIDHKQ